MLFLALDGMNGRLRRGQRENQPAVVGVNDLKVEDIAEEGTIGLGILAVEHNVSALNHAAEYIHLGQEVELKLEKSDSGLPARLQNSRPSLTGYTLLQNSSG